MNGNTLVNVTGNYTITTNYDIWDWVHKIGKRKSQKFATVQTGGRLNKKDGLTRYGDSHVKDKTS